VTKADEGLRLKLPDGSALYLNERTKVTLTGERRLRVDDGEVLLDIVLATASTALSWTIQTPQRTITAVQARLSVQTSSAGTGVVVTRGTAQVVGLSEEIRAGHCLAPDDLSTTVAPLPTETLAWLRNLMDPPETSLVPVNPYNGGTLVAADASGQKHALSLRTFHVDVYIQDGFARTTIDQTFFNESEARLEGTFHFPLPPDASLSRLAMYVDGKLMEGGMAERGHARQVFETIVNTKRDPALLEWLDGRTFRMRVFPLEGRQEKRILLSYVQRLETCLGHIGYRFQAGHSLDAIQKWSFHAQVHRGAALSWHSPSHPEMIGRQADGDLILDCSERDSLCDRDVILDLAQDPVPSRWGLPPEAAQFATADLDGARYLMLRYRPQIPPLLPRTQRDWIFVVETSGDRDPLLARAQIEIVRGLLANADAGDSFTVMTAATRVQTFDAVLRPITPQNIDAAIRFLERAHLVGALDLGNALAVAGALAAAVEHPYLVHVGGARPVIGQTSHRVLLERLPARLHYVGIGVGRLWNGSFMERAAEQTSGYFTHLDPDEPIAWRAWELAARLGAACVLHPQVEDEHGKLRFLSFERALAPGQEFFAIARIDRESSALPGTLTFTGNLSGTPFRRTLAVRHVQPSANYLPRSWAKLEIDRLVAEDPVKNEKRIVAISKEMYVMSPYTSLLVLENEAMYAQYNVDRGRKDHWATYQCPDQIPVVNEPLSRPAASQGDAIVRSEFASKTEEVLRSILIRVPRPVLAPFLPVNPPSAQRVITAWDLTPSDYGLAREPLVVPPEGQSPDSFGIEAGIANASRDSHETRNPWAAVPSRAATREDKHADLRWQALSHRRSAWNNLLGAGANGLAGAAGIRGLGGLEPRGGIAGLSGIGGLSGLGGVAGLGGSPLGIGVPQAGRDEDDTSVADVLSYRLLGTGWRYDAEPLRQDSRDFVSARHDLHALVAQSVNIELPETDLQAALDELGALLKVTIIIDAESFKADLNIPDIAATSVHLGPMRNVALGMVLQLLCAQVQGAYRIRGDVIEITTQDRVVQERMRHASLLLDGSHRRCARQPLTYVPTYRMLPPVADDTEDFLTALRTGNILDPRWSSARHAGESRAANTARERVAVRPSEKWLSAFVTTVCTDPSVPSQFYQRPSFTGDDEVFRDLVSFAPGLNTTPTDIRAVLEAEPDGPTPAGFIDPAARELIEMARSAGWRRVTVPAQGNQPSFEIVCDGAGRYSYQRTLPTGLVEIGVCDGRTLLHLYPELGLGAGRVLSRHHRGETTGLVPWLLPPPEDLARGADVRLLDARSVAVVRRSDAGEHSAWTVRLRFGDSGQLVERVLEDTPTGRTLLREHYSGDGLVRVQQGTGSEWTLGQWVGVPAPAPDLHPDLKNLVMLALPLRTPGHGDPFFSVQDHRPDEPNSEALPLAFKARFGSPSEALQLQWFGSGLKETGDIRPGFFVLWAAIGCRFSPDHADLLSRQRAAVARYFYSLDPWNPDDGPTYECWATTPLLRGLAHLRCLHQERSASSSGRNPDEIRKNAWARALDYVRQAPTSSLSWAVAGLVNEAAGDDPAIAATLAECFPRFTKVAGLSYAARYEQAACLFRAGQMRDARACFERLFGRQYERGRLPSVDQRFRESFGGDDEGQTAWASLVRRNVARLLRADRRNEIVDLAWLCQELGDGRLAQETATQALNKLDRDPERWVVALKAAGFWLRTDRLEQAEQALQWLLAEGGLPRSAAVWRFGAVIAARRQETDAAAARLERSLALEAEQAAEVIDLPAIRGDYGALLAHFQERANAYKLLGLAPPDDLAARVVSAADHWRAVDPDMLVCQIAAQVLKSVGAHDLAWDYLSMTFQHEADAGASCWRRVHDMVCTAAG
jgi:hypothetical protein